MSEFEKQLTKAVTRMSGRSIPTTDYSLSQEVRVNPAQFPDALRVAPFSAPSTGMSRDWSGGQMQLAVGDFRVPVSGGRRRRPWAYSQETDEKRPPVTSEDEDVNVAPSAGTPLPTATGPQRDPFGAVPAPPTDPFGGVPNMRKYTPVPMGVAEPSTPAEPAKRASRPKYQPPTQPGRVGATKVYPFVDKPERKPRSRKKDETATVTEEAQPSPAPAVPQKREKPAMKSLTKPLGKTMGKTLGRGRPSTEESEYMRTPKKRERRGYRG